MTRKWDNRKSWGLYHAAMILAAVLGGLMILRAFNVVGG